MLKTSAIAALSLLAPLSSPLAATMPCMTSSQPAFGIQAGVIFDPSQKPFLPRGINIGPQDMTTVAASGPTLFPGMNFIRLATWKDAPYSMAQYQAFVAAMTAKGIVVEFEDHAYPSPPPYTGRQLADESAWYAALASVFKNDPYVWFGTMNEPGGGGSYMGTGPGISAQHLATYTAIRGTGSNAILMMNPFGGGNPGSVGAGFGLTASVYSGMTNVAWDLHFYGWAVPNGSTKQSDVNAALAGSVRRGYGIAAAQTITGAGGTMIPVIIGEFGDSTDGKKVDANGTQVVKAVLESGHGFAAWTWGGNGGPDTLVQGRTLTRLGQQVAAGIKAAAAAAANGAATTGCQATSAATVQPAAPPTVPGADDHKSDASPPSR